MIFSSGFFKLYKQATFLRHGVQARSQTFWRKGSSAPSLPPSFPVPPFPSRPLPW